MDRHDLSCYFLVTSRKLFGRFHSDTAYVCIYYDRWLELDQLATKSWSNLGKSRVGRSFLLDLLWGRLNVRAIRPHP